MANHFSLLPQLSLGANQSLPFQGLIILIYEPWTDIDRDNIGQFLSFTSFLGFRCGIHQTPSRRSGLQVMIDKYARCHRLRRQMQSPSLIQWGWPNTSHISLATVKRLHYTRQLKRCYGGNNTPAPSLPVLHFIGPIDSSNYCRIDCASSVRCSYTSPQAHHSPHIISPILSGQEEKERIQ